MGDDEPEQPQPAVPGHLSPVSHGQRKGCFGRRRPLDADQPGTSQAAVPELPPTGHVPVPSRPSVSAEVRQVYTGSLDGLVYTSLDAQVNDNPTWKSIDTNLPHRPRQPVRGRPVGTPGSRTSPTVGTTPPPGGNQGPRIQDHRRRAGTWANVSGNLPDVPGSTGSSSIPRSRTRSTPGTDVGPFVTDDGGAHWVPLGSELPDRGRLAARSRPLPSHSGCRNARARRLQDLRRQWRSLRS